MVNTKQSDTCSTSTLAVGCFTGAANLESHLVQKLAVKASSLKISVAVFPVLRNIPHHHALLILSIKGISYIFHPHRIFCRVVKGFMKKRFVLPSLPVIICTIVTILDQCFCTASPMCSPSHHHLLPH